MSLKKKAPLWFIKNQNKIEKLEQEVANLFGYGKHWIDKQINTGNIIEHAKEKNFSENKILKLQLLLEYIFSLRLYIWARYTYKNVKEFKDLTFILEYDDTKKQIVYRRNKIMNKIRTAIQNIKQ